MKKKSMIVCISIVLIIAAAIVIFMTRQTPQTMLSMNQNDITKIVLTNGNNGNTITITDEDINELCSLMENVKIKKVKAENSTGWQYYIDIYKEDKVVERITMISGELCDISEQKYSIAKKEGEGILALLDKLFTN